MGKSILPFRMSGRYELDLVRGDYMLWSQKGRNLVTRVGEKHAAERFQPTGPPAAIDWMALGDDPTSPTKSDTLLAGELGGSFVREQSDSDIVTANELAYVFTYTALTTITIAEIGLFNDAAFETGVMAARFLPQLFQMDTDDVITLTWTLTFSGID